MKKNKKLLIGIFALLLVGIIFVSASSYFSMGQFHQKMEDSDSFEQMRASMVANNMGGVDHEAMMKGLQLGDFKMATLPGQDSFGAIAEIVNILDKDTGSDWNKVNINGLRLHLIDMDLLIKNTNVQELKINDGINLKITSNHQRTVDAIKRMVPTHAEMVLKKMWDSSVLSLENGVVLEVKDTKDSQKIRALGFYGLMAYGGNHHQVHHMALARGEMTFN